MTQQSSTKTKEEFYKFKGLDKREIRLAEELEKLVPDPIKIYEAGLDGSYHHKFTHGEIERVKEAIEEWQWIQSLLKEQEREIKIRGRSLDEEDKIEYDELVKDMNRHSREDLYFPQAKLSRIKELERRLSKSKK